MDIAILGAGIGGLTTALALNKGGVQAQIYESATEIKAVGAGIWMPPNAMLVFDFLGVGNEIRKAGVPLKQIRVMDTRQQIISEIKGDWLLQNYGSQTISIERAVLHHILASHLEPQQLQLGYVCQKITETKENLLVDFKNGESKKLSHLIAADGLKSVARTSMGDRRPLRYSGQTCFRGIVDSETIPELNEGSIEVWGRGARLGLSPISSGKYYWYAAVNAKSKQQYGNSEAIQILLKTFKNFPAFILQFLSQITPETLIQTDLFDLSPGSKWVSDRMALLGDAAHATTPNLGQGAAMAVEDAMVLTQKIKSRNNNFSSSFVDFNKERKARVAHIVNTSWQVGQLAKYKNPLLIYLRNSLLRNIPKKFVHKQLNDIYNSKIKFENDKLIL
jgi:2-polyprenyl-6-methoxyphenol hydroxylase-like FAD-dependent oxidoreductase